MSWVLLIQDCEYNIPVLMFQVNRAKTQSKKINLLFAPYNKSNKFNGNKV